MKPMPQIILFLIAATAGAQCNLATPGGVALAINGRSPAVSDPGGHAVEVGTAPWSLSIDDPIGGSPFVLAGGAGIACGSFPTPWGGSIDLGSPFLVLDGLNPQTPLDAFATTNLSIVIPPLAFAAVCGQSPTFGPALQAIAWDPSNPPFLLRNSEAGVPMSSGPSTVYDAMADDSFVAHSLSCPLTFAGVARTVLYIGSNGQITFAAGSTAFSPSASTFFDGFGSPTNPGVAALWNDYARTYVPDDDITVTESSAQGTIEISYNRQRHWSSTTDSGSWRIIFGSFGSDSFSIDVGGYLAGTSADLNPIIGVTDGVAATGLDTNGDLSALIAAGGGVYVSPSGPHSIMEQFPDVMVPDFQAIHFLHQGAFTWQVLF